MIRFKQILDAVSRPPTLATCWHSKHYVNTEKTNQLPNRHICQNWYPWFDAFLWPKKSFFGIFESGFGVVFRSCLRIIFGLKRPIFRCNFRSKRRYMTSEIKVVGHILALWECHFDHLQGKKIRVLFFLKVGL